MGAEDFLNFVAEKLRELWLAVQNFWGQIPGWFDKVFPPETRPELKHWLLIALLILIVLVLTWALYSICICCCRCCCRGRRGRHNYKMMKAPGRNCRMPRHVFEEDPRSYFQNLRAYPGDELC